MNSKPSTLIILAPAFPAHEKDSVWVPPKQLFVKTLRQQYPHLQVMVLSFNYPYHTGTYAWHGATVVSFNGMNTRKWKRVRMWMQVWRKLRQLRKQHNIIGLFSFWCTECALVGSYFGRLYGIPHYTWISGQDAKANNRLVKFIRPAAKELVAMSAFLGNLFYNNHGIRPRYLVPIGIDTAEFDTPPAMRDIDMLGVGSLIPLKQYAVFICIIHQLRQRFPAIRAVICGGGEQQEHLQSLIEQLQLQNHVTLAGVVEHDEALRYMQRSRVFLHTSCYEGFGAVCIEALYAGCEVISFTNPMLLQLEHWHIAASETEMEAKAAALLARPDPVYQPFLLYEMKQSAQAIMQLFDYAG